VYIYRSSGGYPGGGWYRRAPRIPPPPGNRIPSPGTLRPYRGRHSIHYSIPGNTNPTAKGHPRGIHRYGAQGSRGMTAIGTAAITGLGTPGPLPGATPSTAHR
jgi:hypothetical protein